MGSLKTWTCTKLLEPFDWLPTENVWVEPDLFDRTICDPTRCDLIFGVMALCSQQQFYLHTDRPDSYEEFVDGIRRDEIQYATWVMFVSDVCRMRDFYKSLPRGEEPRWPLENVQLVGNSFLDKQRTLH
jgi:hypothetical protein